MSTPLAHAANPALPPALVAIGALAGAATTYVITTARTRSMRELLHRYRHDARHDPLTGLPNRTVAIETLTTDTTAMVGVCDLNDFKNVNDRHGHAVGDELLRRVAQRLETAMNATGAGLACRLAGDEFALFWRQVPDRPLIEGTRVTDAVTQPLVINGHILRPSISLGLALTKPSLTGTDLLAAADVALYDAKHQHQTVVLYPSDLSPGPVDRPVAGGDRRIRSRRTPHAPT